MDGFRQASCVARHHSDTYSPVFWPATFLSLCESQLGHEILRSVNTRGASAYFERRFKALVPLVRPVRMPDP
jgi:hypothetical protein